MLADDGTRSRRGRRWFWFLFASFGWAVGVICIAVAWYYYNANQSYYDTSGGIYETYHSGAKDGSDKVAIIRVEGLIVDGKGYVQSQIRRVKEDPTVKAVVLRVDSPGGTVTGSDYIFHYLKKMLADREIPVVVSMGSIAASGGYYVAMAVGDEQDSILAEPTTTTGSIGVILPHYDVTGLMDRFDVKDDSFRSHERKQMLSVTREISAEHREILQAQVDEMFVRFKEVVHFGRPNLRPAEGDESSGEVKLVDPNTGRDLATGETFSSQQAMQFGLIDQIGFLEDAIEIATTRSGANEEDVRVVQYTKPKPLIELPALIQASEYAQPGVDSLSPLQMQQPFYLSYDPLPIMMSRIVRSLPN